MQTYQEIVDIITSLAKVKGVRIQIKSGCWGEEYAADADSLPTCTGVVDRWLKVSTKDTLMVRWAGYARNQ